MLSWAELKIHVSEDCKELVEFMINYLINN